MADIHNKGNVNKDEHEQINTNAVNFNCPACGPGTNPLQTPYPGYPCINYKYYPTYMYVPGYAYPEALRLIVESVSGEREDELFYNYMISIAPPEQKEIIASIRDDEIKHNKMLREIYWELTGQEISAVKNGAFQPPDSYCNGITKALFGELAAVERYRKILFGLEFLPYRNMITEIYTDELKHGSKWNYLFTVNCSLCKR
ncbi:ferritin-like domain-containing protein [Pelotomaculum isophthalicicum JI]|uniref:Ferritin-like domain-containing protein n=1 Tax=Pelotomaculum isophthalicicum JI TaxID=947010 RepID=A0A9X4JVU4_9FIRM|nr:ferritin-like domain-containing protein [Pelotomaculum isophthalicicum]MDF9407993.1 ferritin-like domain-containing protein [Pelotomaculum isophthalicicum JI]